MRSLASKDDSYFVHIERFTLLLRHRAEPRWTRLRELLRRNGLAPEQVLVADYSGEGPSRFDGRDGESVHLVLVTHDSNALLLNVFLDGADVEDAIRSIEELPTSGDGSPTIEEALQRRRDGDRSRSNLTQVAYLDYYQAGVFKTEGANIVLSTPLKTAQGKAPSSIDELRQAGIALSESR